jgi:hypothetical protein
MRCLTLMVLPFLSCTAKPLPGAGDGGVPDGVFGDAWLDLDRSPADLRVTEADPGDTGTLGDSGEPLEDVEPELDTPPLEVPGVDDSGPGPCGGAACAEGATCVVVGGAPTCLVLGELVETFDDTAKADLAATTATWGGGKTSPAATTFAGSGKDGPFVPDTDTVVDTAVGGGVFEYTQFHVPAGVTVWVKGPHPWRVNVQGDAVIDGTIRSQGEPGLHVCAKPDGSGALASGAPVPGGAGGAGGSQGGAGGAGYGAEGEAGEGPVGGAGSLGATESWPVAAAGAGGGGFGGDGEAGVGQFGGTGGEGGAAHGDVALLGLLGGSGGGGGHGKDLGGSDGTCGDVCPAATSCWQGACGKPIFEGDGIANPFDRPGASGGGGGGGIGLVANGTITLRGAILVDGGLGGWGDWSGAGGGGSGGAIRLTAWKDIWLDAGTLSARGGKGGLVSCSNQSTDIKAGAGGGGRIRLAAVNGVSAGFLVDPDPPPSFASAAVAADGGTGKDGVFSPAGDTVLDTELGPYHFTSFELKSGVTLTAVGSKPLEIRSQGSVLILGTIELDGAKGGHGYSACCGNPYSSAHAGQGGAGAAGGFDGGSGGEAGSGASGAGPGGSAGGPVGFFSSSGGAGHATTGQPGGTNQCNLPGPSGGASYGDPTLATLEGGSGGGGAGDAVAGACTWCQSGMCLSTDLEECPAAPTCGGFCGVVASACSGGEAACTATQAWNPGSGGGGGGGALRIETPGLVRLDGALLLDGGDGGDSLGASDWDDQTCAASCPAGDGCAKGVCNPTGSGSFGGSGGGGSGGALLVRAGALRAEGVVKARGGGSGTLSQGGGCAADPDASNPLPGQGRGGRGSPGRLRIETETPAGSVLIDGGSFSRGEADPGWGVVAQSGWYALGGSEIWVLSAVATGLGPSDALWLQVATDAAGAPGVASAWEQDPSALPTGGWARFRIDFAVPSAADPIPAVDQVTLQYAAP